MKNINNVITKAPFLTADFLQFCRILPRKYNQRTVNNYTFLFYIFKVYKQSTMEWRRSITSHEWTSVCEGLLSNVTRCRERYWRGLQYQHYWQICVLDDIVFQHAYMLLPQLYLPISNVENVFLFQPIAFFQDVSLWNNPTDKGRRVDATFMKVFCVIFQKSHGSKLIII